MMLAKQFTSTEAQMIGDAIGIDWRQVDLEQFRMGLAVELEHGVRDPRTDVTGNNPILTGKIALAHLKELPDYYTRLARIEMNNGFSARQQPEMIGMQKGSPGVDVGHDYQTHKPEGAPETFGPSFVLNFFLKGMLIGTGTVLLAKHTFSKS